MAGHGFENRAPRGSLRRRSRSQYRKSGIANRPAIFPRSPIAAETAVLAPNSESVWRGECTNASLPSPPPAASSRPTKATAAPATDRTTTDNQNENGAQAPTSQFRFPTSLQRAGTGIGNSGQVGTAGPHACPSNALKTGPSNCVIVLSKGGMIILNGETISTPWEPRAARETGGPPRPAPNYWPRILAGRCPLNTAPRSVRLFLVINIQPRRAPR